MTRVPLDDHAAMYVAASRRRHPPSVGVVRRFEQPIDAATLTAYAAQLAANPRGFGRRVVPARIPGARPSWEPACVLPPVRVESEARTAADIAEILNDEVSAQLDPRCDPGWRLTALAGENGGMLVLTWLHHAYGDGRSILETAFAPAVGDEQPRVSARPTTELGDVVARVRRGVAGSVRLGRDAATVGWRRPQSELARLRPAVDALRLRDRGVGCRSLRRVVALARVPVTAWDDAAAERGGSGNALLLAILANLLRIARQSRGELEERPLRLLLPFDTRLRQPLNATSAESVQNASGAATVVLPGGAPTYGSLAGVRSATKQALRDASAAVSAGSSARPPGVVDAMDLLPHAITQRVAVRVQAHADGVASNVGSIPDHVAALGRHVASEVFLLAGPMLTDLTVCLGRDRDALALGVVADAARLGPVGGLQELVGEELAAWGLPAVVG